MKNWFLVSLVIFSLSVETAFSQNPEQCLNCFRNSGLKYDQWKGFWGAQICSVAPALLEKNPDELKKIAKAESHPFKRKLEKKRSRVGNGGFALGYPGSQEGGFGRPFQGATGSEILGEGFLMSPFSYGVPGFSSAGQAVIVSILAGQIKDARSVLKRAKENCQIENPTGGPTILLDPSCEIYDFSISDSKVFDELVKFVQTEASSVHQTIRDYDEVLFEIADLKEKIEFFKFSNMTSGEQLEIDGRNGPQKIVEMGFAVERLSKEKQNEYGALSSDLRKAIFKENKLKKKCVGLFESQRDFLDAPFNQPKWKSHGATRQ